MHLVLHEIAELLRARGLTIDTGTDPADAAEQVWHVSDVPEETVIRVMMMPDMNNYPSFWTPAVAGSAAKIHRPDRDAHRRCPHRGRPATSQCPAVRLTVFETSGRPAVSFADRRLGSRAVVVRMVERQILPEQERGLAHPG